MACMAFLRLPMYVSVSNATRGLIHQCGLHRELFVLRHVKGLSLCVVGLLLACSPKHDAVEEAAEQASERGAGPLNGADAPAEAPEWEPLDLSLPEDLSWEPDGEAMNAPPRQFNLDGLFNKGEESTLSIYALPTVKPTEEGAYLPEVDGASVSITVKGK